MLPSAGFKVLKLPAPSQKRLVSASIVVGIEFNKSPCAIESDPPATRLMESGGELKLNDCQILMLPEAMKSKSPVNELMSIGCSVSMSMLSATNPCALKNGKISGVMLA